MFFQTHPLMQDWIDVASNDAGLIEQPFGHLIWLDRSALALRKEGMKSK